MSQILAMLREKRAERKKVTDAAQAMLTKAHTEKRSLSSDEDVEWNKRHEEGDKLWKEIERLEKQHEADTQLSAKAADTRSAGREDFTGTGEELGEVPADYEKKKKEFRDIELRRWLAKDTIELPQQLLHKRAKLADEIGPFFRREMRQMLADETWDARAAASLRALSATTGTAGADTIPISFMYQLEVATKYFGGINQAADYIDTDDGRQLPWPTFNDVTNTGETIAENTGVAGSGDSGANAEQDPTYGVINFNAYMNDTGFVLCPVQLIQDSAFNVETYLNEALDIRLGRRMNTQGTVGTGSGQATGFLTVATQGATSATGNGLVWNDLVNLFHSVDPSYRGRPKSGWQLADTTVAILRKLVDNNGRPLWLAGGTTGDAVSSGAPGKIMDALYWVNQDMPAVGLNNKAIAYGDFSKYKIRRVRTLQMVRANERFIDKLQIGFLGFLRFDGNLVDAGMHPIKYLQQAAS